MSRVVDCHLHVYDYGFWASRWFDFVAESWARTPPRSRDPGVIRGVIESGMVDADGSRMIQHMDDAGIDLGILLPLDWELGMREKPQVSVQDLNDRHQRIVQQHPERLKTFFGIDPLRENATELFSEALRRESVMGLKLYPPTGWYPHDRRAYPLYELCVEHDVPVLCHTGGTIGILKPRFANPLFLQDVQADFPELKLWLGHAGASFWWDEAVAVTRNGINTYLELSNWEDLAFDEPEAFIRRLWRVRERLGPHRLLFGSDHFSGAKFRGVSQLTAWIDWFRDLPARGKRYGAHFSDEDVELILGGNAVRCLGLPEHSASTTDGGQKS